MQVCLSTDSIVEAERVGHGRLPWMWVFVCVESALVLARSEPMFRTRAAALRAGERVMRLRSDRLG